MPAWGWASAFRFFLEIKPVDMNAVGSGFAALKLLGVAKVESAPSGREAPIGREREKGNGGFEVSAII